RIRPSVTGSSVFDFDGDGSVEVVYGDQEFLRIYRATDGAVLFETPKSSTTAFELPLVVDVDADGNAEIIGVANDFFVGSETGIYVIGDGNDTWVPTRQIWNQHSYHVTNVNDDGSIPQFEQNSWEAHNTFRANLEPDRNPFAAPDLSASYVRTETSGSDVTATARMGNGGEVLVAPGLSVAFYDGDPGDGGSLLGTVLTSERLRPGEFEDVAITLAAAAFTELWVVADDDGTGKGSVNECDEENNVHHLAGTGEIRGTKFNDANGDGSRDVDETGLEGWTIYLDQNQNGRRDVGEQFTVTDSGGNYAFTGLPNGTYYVAEEQQAGWVATSPESGFQEVEIVSGSIHIQDGDFLDWSFDATGTATATVEQTGGNPDARLNVTTVSGPTVYATAINHDVSTVAKLEGAAFTLDLDVKSGPGSFGAGQSIEILIEQNDS
ncbi:unnamed protein product, partial [marine sediment metagenome]